MHAVNGASAHDLQLARFAMGYREARPKDECFSSTIPATQASHAGFLPLRS